MVPLFEPHILFFLAKKPGKSKTKYFQVEKMNVVEETPGEMQRPGLGSDLHWFCVFSLPQLQDAKTGQDDPKEPFQV